MRTVVMKNCEPFVSGPALAMERRPGPVWRSLKLFVEEREKEGGVRRKAQEGGSSAPCRINSETAGTCKTHFSSANLLLSAERKEYQHSGLGGARQTGEKGRREGTDVPVDALATGAVSPGKVATLDHKVLDDPARARRISTGVVRGGSRRED